MSRAQILGWLRGIFIYVVAFALPLAGAVIAVLRFTEGEREEGLRIALAAVLGLCVYGLVFTA